ncbi:lipocalin-like domain-containing protein [Aureibaculum sp. 2210JD6-5]|uniref:lipocalin-like domain-containing protein n=1 Tax=Aureibaculum sp. 2210JD6-5 TaxID=3103957 RepID=UPI002AADCFE9|nr:lipocalin-like domain-containing protein [Aureibaculum sp. 2210JD6-5]MDY7393855.1 lipocalin-like domain-containing protein [Aureibaculum sp. 2210JD6-5]
MKTQNIWIIVIMTVLFVGCNQKNEEIESNPFSGLWSLHIMEQQDSITGVWNKWRNGMQGYILYDANDNMALHLTTKGYEKTELRFPNFNDTIPNEALKHLTNSYVYFAKYTIDEKEGIVEHARISHSNPGDWNKVVKRRFTFSGDTLILQPVEKSNSGLRLKWIKESD